MLEHITHQQRVAHGGTNIAVNTPVLPMLLSGYSLDAESWQRINYIEVIAQQQYHLLRCSRETLDIWNKIKGEPAYSIPLTESWQGRTYGYIPLSTPNTIYMLQFRSAQSHPSKAIAIESRGLALPKEYQELKEEEIDFQWMVLTHEHFIQPYQSSYDFSGYQSTLLRVLVESIKAPFLTYGPGLHFDLQPQESSPGWWDFDLRGETPFDTRTIRGLAVGLPEQNIVHTKILVELTTYYPVAEEIHGPNARNAKKP